MYMAVLQRTREIGILKSLGASKAFILGIILMESVLLGIGGTVLGIVMSFGAWWLIQTLVPAMETTVKGSGSCESARETTPRTVRPCAPSAAIGKTTTNVSQRIMVR